MKALRRWLACLAMLPMLTAAASAQDKPKIKLGFAKCAHCTPLVLTPEYAKDIDLEVIPFNTGNDVLTALISKSIDVGQITYLHYATALDKGFDVVAISGQVNGGSQILLSNDLPVEANDWAGLKKLIAERKAAGKIVKVAPSPSRASTFDRTLSSSTSRTRPTTPRLCAAAKST
jgi:ABC-type nitrate/sulfonate/bicarbonate transport system substrate-binding protein